MTRLIPFKMTFLWSPILLIFIGISFACLPIFSQSAQESTIKFIAKPTTCLSQSDAHLAHQDILSYIQSAWLDKIAENEQLEAIIQLAIERERKQCNHFVFYHGQAGPLRIVQDFLAEIYTPIMKKKMHDFIFLRFWGNADKHTDLKKLLDNYGITWQSDHEHAIQKRLISVNLALFGNSLCRGECSFHYFLESMSIKFDGTVTLETYLKEIFEYYAFNECYISELVDLEKSIDVKTGNLIQIFIPREKVDTYVYASGAFGVPIANPFDQHWLHTDKVNNSEDKSFPLSTMLDLYTKNSCTFEYLDELQGRILISQDGMLDPTSGIIMYRYTLEKPEATYLYTQKLQNIVARMLNDWSTQKIQGK